MSPKPPASLLLLPQWYHSHDGALLDVRYSQGWDTAAPQYMFCT